MDELALILRPLGDVRLWGEVAQGHRIIPELQQRWPVLLNVRWVNLPWAGIPKLIQLSLNRLLPQVKLLLCRFLATHLQFQRFKRSHCTPRRPLLVGHRRVAASHIAQQLRGKWVLTKKRSHLLAQELDRPLPRLRRQQPQLLIQPIGDHRGPVLFPLG